MKKFLITLLIMILVILVFPLPKPKGYFCDFPPCESYNSIGKIIITNAF